MTVTAKKSSDPSEARMVVLSPKVAFTLPVVLIVVGIVSSNLTMMLGMSGKTDVLDTKIVTISEDVAEIKQSLAAMSTELTNVRVELATLKAEKK